MSRSERLDHLDEQRRMLYELLKRTRDESTEAEAQAAKSVTPDRDQGGTGWQRWGARGPRSPWPTLPTGFRPFSKRAKVEPQPTPRSKPKRESAAKASPLVPLKATGTRPPLIVVHAVLGTSFQFRELARNFAADRPLFGLTARGLNGGDNPVASFPEMAKVYADAICETAPSGRLHVGGYSLGSYIAFELARELTARGRDVGRLLLFGLGAPMSILAPHRHEQGTFWLQYAEDMVRVLTQSLRFGGLDLGSAAARLPPPLRVALANLRGFATYQPEPLARQVDLFITCEQEAQLRFRPLLDWDKLATGGVALHRLAGNHLSMFEAPHAVTAATAIAALLAAHDDED